MRKKKITSACVLVDLSRLASETVKTSKPFFESLRLLSSHCPRVPIRFPVFNCDLPKYFFRKLVHSTFDNVAIMSIRIRDLALDDD
jgi:hypothetical protein